eukprot:scaffold62562_cov44-Cyclotella_meneghiniana.AAC.1
MGHISQDRVCACWDGHVHTFTMQVDDVDESIVDLDSHMNNISKSRAGIQDESSYDKSSQQCGSHVKTEESCFILIGRRHH